MKKSLIICLIVIVLIVIGDILMQKNINKTFNYMMSELVRIDNISNYDEKIKETDKLKSYWDNKCVAMACYIEHVELEKIQSQLVVVKAGMQVNDKAFVHEEIERTVHIIDLIMDKKSLRIDNIF